MSLLTIEELCIDYPVKRGIFARDKLFRAVDRVSLKLEEGQALGVVGESGSGKSSLVRGIVRLVEPSAGAVSYSGTDVLALSPLELMKMRKHMQLVFQDPYACLNPRMSLCSQIQEPLRNFGLDDSRAAVTEILNRVELNENFLHRFPHELSGGQRQRVGIARALAPKPKILICDEPVSALDVSVQAQILNLLKNLQREMGLSLIFITHDIGVVRYMSDRILVMQQSKLVEEGECESLITNPKQAYTQSLLASVPQL